MNDVAPPEGLATAWIARAGQRVQAGQSVVVATDFDGTLSAIAAAPQVARWVDGAEDVLRRLGRVPGVAVAVISGRVYDDLARICAPVEPIWIGAEHGGIVRRPDGTFAVRPDVNVSAIAALEQEAIDVTRGVPGARIELKTYSVAVHVREVRDRAAASAILERYRAFARRTGAGIFDGREIVEAIVGRGDKGGALRTILREVGEDAPAVYAGDDANDAPALELLASDPRGLALFIRSSERPEPPCAVDAVLDGPLAWLAMLRRVAVALGR